MFRQIMISSDLLYNTIGGMSDNKVKCSLIGYSAELPMVVLYCHLYTKVLK